MADKLIWKSKAIDAICSKGRKAWDTLAVDDVRIIIQADAVEALMQTPAVDAVPVVRSLWVYRYRKNFDGTRYWFRQCFHCGYERNDDDPDKDTKFCPNCGAVMGGDEHEAD